jgi:hypothetical protein
MDPLMRQILLVLPLLLSEEMIAALDAAAKKSPNPVDDVFVMVLKFLRGSKVN